jgi:hypothetical protein
MLKKNEKDLWVDAFYGVIFHSIFLGTHSVVTCEGGTLF